MNKIAKLLLVPAMLISTLIAHYGDANTQNEGWTLVGVGGYETRGEPGFFLCIDQC